MATCRPSLKEMERESFMLMMMAKLRKEREKHPTHGREGVTHLRPSRSPLGRVAVVRVPIHAGLVLMAREVVLLHRMHGNVSTRTNDVLVRERASVKAKGCSYKKVPAENRSSMPVHHCPASPSISPPPIKDIIEYVVRAPKGAARLNTMR